jgi:DNA-binding SARP family transcriptional activator
LSRVVEFRLLGSVEIRGAQGEPLRLNRRMERLALAVLLLEPGRVVSTDRLIDLLWEQDPPAAARAALQTLMSRIRRAIRSVAGDEARLVTRGQGYVLHVEPERVDVHRFLGMVDDARAIGDAQLRASRLAAALELWRGPALADAATGAVREQLCGSLEESRFRAVSERIDAELAVGRHAELIPELAMLVAEHPLREDVHGQLMLALYRCGRRAEALDAYRRARQLLVAELGLEPGPQLRSLEAAIIADTGGLDLTGPATGRPSPAQLPADLAGFVGRTPYLRQLDALLDSPSPATTCVITGTAGVGKTSVAVHWAHQVRRRFPDGQLYVNLRGFDLDAAPTSPTEAIRDFLEALHVPAGQIPGSLPAQTAMYRSLLADKRILILLDNARESDQVRPLLPGSPSCLVIVTSRNTLSGLVASEGAAVADVDLLSSAEAGELLARRLGDDRVEAEPAAVGDIVARCARLPIALAIAAARVATSPGMTLPMLAAELGHAGDGLDAFDGEDAATQVRRVFACSYRVLTPAAAHLFRLLGVHCGPDIGAPAAASLAGIPYAEVFPLLAELTRAHLLSETRTGRYASHDLLRAYAKELGGDPEGLHRMLDYYLHTAHRGALLLEPRRESIALTPPAAGVIVEDLTDQTDAMAWFTAEHAVLLAAIPYAAEAGIGTYAWQSAWTIATFFNRQGRWHSLIAALHDIPDLADRQGQAHIHRLLGLGNAHLGRDEEAATHLRYALDITIELNDRVGQANVYHNIVWLLTRQNRTAEALEHAHHALDIYQAEKHLAGVARMLNVVGWLQVALGRYEEAINWCEWALAGLVALDDRPGQANTWDSLGYAHHHAGNQPKATSCYAQALDLFRQDGDRFHEADTLAHLGDAQHAAGAINTARETWREALAIYQEIGHADADQIRTKLATERSSA